MRGSVGSQWQRILRSFHTVVNSDDGFYAVHAAKPIRCRVGISFTGRRLSLRPPNQIGDNKKKGDEQRTAELLRGDDGKQWFGRPGPVIGSFQRFHDSHICRFISASRWRDAGAALDELEALV